MAIVRAIGGTSRSVDPSKERHGVFPNSTIAYFAKDNSIHLSRAAANLHDKPMNWNACPKCRASGRVDGTPITEKREVSVPMESMNITETFVIGYNDDVCDLCNGAGYTEKKYRNITKLVTEGLGFEEVPND